MTSRLASRASAALDRVLPERRLYLRSEGHTRFNRLGPWTQLLAWTGGTVLVGWTIVATAIVGMDSIGAGNFRAQAQRDKLLYEDRLNELAAERDLRADEAVAAQARFALALREVSAMQSRLLASEEERRELLTGLDTVRATLGRAVAERDAALTEVTAATEGPRGASAADLVETVDLLTAALDAAAADRDDATAEAEEAVRVAGDLDLEIRLMEDQNDRIFQQLEDALEISVEPLDDMFRNAGMDPDKLLEEVREGHAGQGGPLTPFVLSSMSRGPADDATLRANAILGSLDRINLYRVAATRVPFSMPVQAGFRYTSGFGPRWGRMHEGIDMAGPIGTPILATADGVVTHAGWSNGYGRLIKIQHEFGIETRYGHLNAIDVQVGQRVSIGDHIGDMGNSGRSTGPHLHYEIRLGGEAVNPMIYIGAGEDVL